MKRLRETCFTKIQETEGISGMRNYQGEDFRCLTRKRLSQVVSAKTAKAVDRRTTGVKAPAKKNAGGRRARTNRSLKANHQPRGRSVAAVPEQQGPDTETNPKGKPGKCPKETGRGEEVLLRGKTGEEERVNRADEEGRA